MWIPWDDIPILSLNGAVRPHLYLFSGPYQRIQINNRLFLSIIAFLFFYLFLPFELQVFPPHLPDTSSVTTSLCLVYYCTEMLLCHFTSYYPDSVGPNVLFTCGRV